MVGVGRCIVHAAFVTMPCVPCAVACGDEVEIPQPPPAAPVAAPPATPTAAVVAGATSETAAGTVGDLDGVATISLAGDWLLVPDPGAVGLEQGWLETLTAGEIPADLPVGPFEVAVPGPLEAPRPLATYDGVVWYATDVTLPELPDDAALDLVFTQANYAVDVWLDGEPIGRHEGGHGPFAFRLVGDAARPTPFPKAVASETVRDAAAWGSGPHRLVVRLLDPGDVLTDGLTLKTTPHAKESWYHNHGGLLDDVAWRVVPTPGIEWFVRPWFGRTPGLQVEFALGVPVEKQPIPFELVLRHDGGEEIGRWSLEVLPSGEGAAKGYLYLKQHEGDVDPASAGRTLQDLSYYRLAEFNGHGMPKQALATALDLPVWSPEQPSLLRFEMRVNGRLLVSGRFGLVSTEFNGGDGLILNGERRVPKAVLYQPHHTGLGGVAPTDEELHEEARAIKAAGFDLVRVHVRPAHPAFLDACDEIGLFVLEEPAIGWVDDSEHLPDRLREETAWMFARDSAHPSIVIWGLLNEMSGKAYRHVDVMREALDLTSRPILEDSGGFVGGGRYAIAGVMLPPPMPLAPMVDEHFYPPYPLPPDERLRMATIAEPSGGPVFASEFGYGTRLDALRVVEGFRERDIWSEERVLFEGMAGAERRAGEARAAWEDLAVDPDGAERAWLGAAQALQADAAEDMVEALRANPELDLLCYTQWRAVSHESSAGLVAPWGEERPAYERMRHALRPLQVSLHAARPSVRTGEEVDWTLTVVNDTGAPVEAEPRLVYRTRHGDVGAGSTVTLPRQVFAPGVTAWVERVPVRAGHHVARAQLWAEGDGGDLALLDQSPERAVTVTDDVVGPWTFALPTAGDDATDDATDGQTSPTTAPAPLVLRPEDIRVWVPDEDPAALGFAADAGFEFLTTLRDGDLPADVALIAHPERIEELGIATLLRLWHHVRTGGSAVLLPSNPAGTELGRMLGAARGVRTLTGLPVEVHVARAPGNFMGRVHVARRTGEAWHRTFVPEGSPAPLQRVLGELAEPTPTSDLLRRGDEALSPLALVPEPLPAGARPGILTLGHLGDRLGAPLVDVPFGAGVFRLVGLPLLEPVGDAPDPLRTRTLADLVASAAALSRAAGPPNARPAFTPPPAALLEPLGLAVRNVSRVVAMADRASPYTVGEPLPLPVLVALEDRNRALAALLDGRVGEAAPLLQQAVAAVWDEPVRNLLAGESRVLHGLQKLLESGTREDWDLAYEVLEMWSRAMGFWFGGERETAFGWIGRAELLLRTERGEDFLPPTDAGIVEIEDR